MHRSRPKEPSRAPFLHPTPESPRVTQSRLSRCSKPHVNPLFLPCRRYTVGPTCLAHSVDSGKSWSPCSKATGLTGSFAQLIVKDSSTMFMFRSGAVPLRTKVRSISLAVRPATLRFGTRLFRHMVRVAARARRDGGRARMLLPCAYVAAFSWVLLHAGACRELILRLRRCHCLTHSFPQNKQQQNKPPKKHSLCRTVARPGPSWPQLCRSLLTAPPSVAAFRGLVRPWCCTAATGVPSTEAPMELTSGKVRTTATPGPMRQATL